MSETNTGSSATRGLKRGCKAKRRQWGRTEKETSPRKTWGGRSWGGSRNRYCRRHRRWPVPPFSWGTGWGSRFRVEVSVTWLLRLNWLTAWVTWNCERKELCWFCLQDRNIKVKVQWNKWMICFHFLWKTSWGVGDKSTSPRLNKTEYCTVFVQQQITSITVLQEEIFCQCSVESDFLSKPNWY